jgi:hypothetical protein
MFPVPPADTPPASRPAIRWPSLSASRSEPGELGMPKPPIEPGVTQFGTSRWVSSRWVPLAAGVVLVLMLLALIVLLVV